MKKTIRTLTTTLALAASLWLLQGCSKDTTTAPVGDTAASAPELPSESTMKFDLDFFGAPTPALDQSLLVASTPSEVAPAMTAGVTATDHENWINAFIRAVYAQLVVYDAVNEPIGAFALAIHSVPQKQGDGSWLWTYIFVDQGTEYDIFLYGTPGPDHATWRMEVSTDNPDFLLDHFVWFEGEAKNDNSSGYWQFYMPVFGSAVAAGTPPTEGTPLMRIDWENLSRREHRLTITVNGPGLENEGDTVEFYESATMGRIDVYDASEATPYNVTWYADGSGSLTVPDYNGGAKACWDTQQRNVECP